MSTDKVKIAFAGMTKRIMFLIPAILAEHLANLEYVRDDENSTITFDCVEDSDGEYGKLIGEYLAEWEEFSPPEYREVHTGKDGIVYYDTRLGYSDVMFRAFM